MSMNVKRLKLFIPLIVFTLMSGLLMLGLEKDPNDLPSVLIGKQMPEFSLPNLADPSEMITAESMEGKPYLLNVWATWCPTCRAEHPYLIKLAEMGIPIYGLNWKDDEDGAKALLKKTGDPFVKTIFDEEGILAMSLGVTGAPETFIVDGSGVIRYRRVSVINEQVWTSLMAPIFFGE